MSGATAGIQRLEDLRKEFGHYIPISTAAMRKAAELWADARRKGIPTADENKFDGDVILAAQAMLYSGLADSLVIATYNARHLSRYDVDAAHWTEISPY
ncbi:MAG TPA: hypothetical protein VKA15_16075 [Isosphaeraceae bacterium]|nr:hypothetical protein [Isosphaeraceae bacterium]